MSDDGAAQKTTAPKARSPSPHFTKEEKKMTENNRLRLAMQKSGRLSDDSQDLLERCGLKVRFHSQRPQKSRRRTEIPHAQAVRFRRLPAVGGDSDG